MRKSVIGAATLALLASTALVSAQQQEKQGASPPAAKEQAQTGDKGGEAGRTKGKGMAQDKSEPMQDRKGSAQKQTDQGKDRTAEPKDKAGDTKRTAEPKDKAGDTKRTAEPKDKAGDTKRTADPKDKAGDRDRDQARGKDGDRDRDRDQARGKDGDRDRDQARGKDGDRDRDRNQARGKDGDRDRDRVNITQNQRTEVREKLSRHREARVTNVNFSINIGTRVPRDFRLSVVPADIVTIVPAYRGYRYFIVEERIVFVHPTSYEIVEVIEVDSGGPRRGGAVTASLELSQPQIALILDRVPMERHRADVRVDLALGAEVPSSVELYEFPTEVVAEVPALRSHRYVVVDKRVVIVDPSGRDVVRVIER